MQFVFFTGMTFYRMNARPFSKTDVLARLSVMPPLHRRLVWLILLLTSLGGSDTKRRHILIRADIMKTIKKAGKKSAPRVTRPSGVERTLEAVRQTSVIRPRDLVVAACLAHICNGCSNKDSLGVRDVGYIHCPTLKSPSNTASPKLASGSQMVSFACSRRYVSTN